MLISNLSPKLRPYLIRMLVVLTLLSISAHGSFASDKINSVPGWRSHFDAAGVTGTIIVFDTLTGRYMASDPSRAIKRYIPASTFKVVHTLFALDAGVADRNSLYRWDGRRQEFSTWESDQTLSSAFRNSVPWVYQGFARRLGEQAELMYLDRIDYGNRSIEGGIDRFWLDGGLEISAYEQIGLLRRLDSESLPFTASDQIFVKDLMTVKVDRDFVLRAKTGWAFEQKLGWYVGWVESKQRRIFFALNMDIEDAKTDPPKRAEIVETILDGLR